MSLLQTTTIQTIAFDADDTLWMNETLFVRTQDAFKAMLQPYLQDEHDIDARLYATEKKNLGLFGYGIKGFMLSLIETAIELTDGRMPGRELQRIIELGKDMLQHPVHLLPEVEETLHKLQDTYELMLITKGDLFDQENKLARSGLADYFGRVEILSEKDPATYRRVLSRHAIEPPSLLMVGNSVKSDILPLLEIGAQAVHVPFHTTWVHEEVSEDTRNGFSFPKIRRMGELLGLLQEHGV